ncbi:PREDICTED: uncharacterized protein LOC108774464 [Cyphomyrmex costatus]|uniref:uncharacterized protein LOC108774464 n=1 Tax=Cyphomyrmex costatus TaxID=456900 RepID=UPI0008524505|nr:PREDICTED: uncharacterized protein LOC108774464 [Cyphomyrmex costatus]
MDNVIMILNLDQHMLCEDNSGNIQISEDPRNPGLVVYDKLNKFVFVVPDNQEVRQFLPRVHFIHQSADQLIKECPKVDIATQFPSTPEIWVRNSGKSSAYDVEATEALIKLVGSDRFKSLLKNKICRKKNVWSLIAKEMITMGYNFGERDPGTVCSTKWRNMEGKIITFVQSGGTKAGKLKPLFYDRIRNIMQDFPRVNFIGRTDVCVQTDESSL